MSTSHGLAANGARKGRTAMEAARKETVLAKSAEPESRQARVAAEARASELSTKLTETAASRDNAQRTADWYQAESAEAEGPEQEGPALKPPRQSRTYTKSRDAPNTPKQKRSAFALAITQESVRSLEAVKQSKK